ncbi:hypothetical protein ACFFK0_27940, partial [Paenibacillus chartarius]
NAPFLGRGELSPCGYWFQNFTGPTPTYSQLLIRSWMIATAFLCAFEIQDEIDSMNSSMGIELK